jgi:hypothetical protein
MRESLSRTLKQWESYLVSVMPRVQLLSEIGLNFEDMQEIAGLIRQENKKRPNIQQTTNYLIRNFPGTFVAFLAAFAAQNTEREFWDALARLLEVSGGELNNSNWRRHFIEILKEYKKPSFEDIGGVTNKYVTSIRIHGGIPSYSLGDFFANMLIPAIEKPEYIELKGKELLGALLARSAVQMFTDSTVRNFFGNSGEIGLEFLESSRHLAQTYRSTRQIPSDHTLPEYVVHKLINFLENREDEVHGLRRPRIKFDAEGEGLLLELPEEPLSGINVLGNQVRWQVYQNTKLLKELRAHITRSGRDVHTEKQEPIPLGYIVEPFQVTFSIPSHAGEFSQIREWTFELRSQDVPNLLVFRSEDGSLLRWSQALPAQNLLLVHPKEIFLEFEGDARVIHTPDVYAEGWHNWKAEHRSLESAFSISLVRSGEKLSTIPIQKQLELPRVIGRLFAPNLDSKPLYIGTPPRLRIPLRPGATIENELKRWHVELNSAWEAEPPCRMDFKLSEKPESITKDESAIEFDLTAMLGNEPKGTYSLRVRGPLETDIEFSFRVWPLLYVKDFPEFILPTEEQNLTLHFTVPSRASLETQAGVTGVNVTGRYGQYVVELDEAVSRLDLNLVWPMDAPTCHVPFSLLIPRIKWRLVLGEEGKFEWSNRLIRTPVEAFLQSNQTAALLIQMPGIEKHTKQMIVRLIDPEKPKEFLQEFPIHSSVLGNDYVRFLLSAKDTVKHHADVSVFEFRLLIPDAVGHYQSVTLLSLTRDIDVSKVRIEETEEGLFLLWSEPVPLRNRRVFIRSMWKLSAGVCNVKIPDDARGKFDLLAAGYGLPPSWYEVHFYVAPSWQEDITSAPDHSTFIVKSISPEDQIDWLEKHLQKHPDQSFVNHFERACLHATTGDTTQRDQEIQFCYTHIDQAKPKDLFAFHEWLNKHESNTMRAVRMKMYNPEQLQHLFASYKPGDEFRRQYERFVIETRIKPESALLLIENEDEPSIVFHALRELVKRRDDHLVGVISLMLEEGRLSDTDATELLRRDEEYYLSDLDSSQPTNINLRLLSGLLQKKDELLSALSNKKILNLAKVDKDPQAIKKYLGILIKREDVHGLEFVMDLFQQGRLLGHEVTELLGENPRFSLSALPNAPQTHAYTIQLSELIRRYPIEAGHIAVGMFIHTPAGWGRIDNIEDASSMGLKVVSKEEKQVKYLVTLYPETEYQIKAILDISQEKLYLVNSEKFSQCGICKFISLDQSFILREHTRKEHGGVGASVVSNLTQLHIHDDMQFSQSHPK